MAILYRVIEYSGGFCDRKYIYLVSESGILHRDAFREHFTEFIESLSIRGGRFEMDYGVFGKGLLKHLLSQVSKSNRFQNTDHFIKIFNSLLIGEYDFCKSIICTPDELLKELRNSYPDIRPHEIDVYIAKYNERFAP